MDDDPTIPRRASRRLDRRTVAICVCIALIGAFAAALVASFALDDDGSAETADPARLELDAPTEVLADRFLAVALETREGDPTSVGALMDDRPVLLNFWQSSCVPCIKEMPLLEQAAAANPDVAVLGVATQDRLDAAERLAAQTGVTYPWVLDPEGNLFYEAQGTGMPTTLVLDVDGTVLIQETGEFKDVEEIQAFLDEGLSRR